MSERMTFSFPDETKQIVADLSKFLKDENIFSSRSQFLYNLIRYAEKRKNDREFWGDVRNWFLEEK